MATLVTRSGKGSPLTHAEVDANFTNLNTDKLELSGGTMTGNLSFGDNDKAIFGAGSDLQIYHNGFNSYVSDNGTGSLNVTTNGAQIALYDTANSQQMVKAVTAGAVELYHNGDLKQATSSTGVDITGEVKADKFTNDEALPDIRPSLLLDFANSKQIDHRMTVARDSIGTYWNGETIKAEENLIGYSTTMGDSNWASDRVTLTTNTTETLDPAGGNTAVKIVDDTTANLNHRLFKVGALEFDEYTISCYVKDGNTRYIGMSAGYGANNQIHAVFDLTSGVATHRSKGTGTSVTLPTTTIQSVGNDWWRISMTGFLPKATASNGIPIKLLFAYEADPIWSTYGNINTTGTGTDYFYAYGAQAERRSFVSTYQPTTSNHGITKYQPYLATAPANQGRIDHTPLTGECKGLLVEEARSNLFVSSTGGMSYIGQGSVRTNDALAPDGSQKALLCIPNTTDTSHVFDKYGATNSTGANTYSVFVKPAGYYHCQLYFQSTGFASGVKFDLSNGTVGTASAGAVGHIEEIGNGWWRIAMTCSPSSITSDIQRFRILGPNGEDNFAGDGYKGMYIWGYQHENGHFPTSYIPTTGTSATRQTDRAVMPVESFYQGGDLTIFTEAQEAGDTDYCRLVLLSDDSNENRVQLVISEQNNTIQAFAEKGDIVQASHDVSFTLPHRQFFKAAAGFSNDATTVTAGGETPTSDTDTAIPHNLTTLYLGSLQYADADSGATFKKVAIYNKKLTDAQLQAMTED